MTTLADLIGAEPTTPPAAVGYWQSVPEWSLAGNDRFSDCTFVALCNMLDLVAAVNGRPFVVGEAEAELFYSREAGFRADNPATDHGAVLAEVIKYWATYGWPADPDNMPRSWCQIAPEELHQTIWSLGASPAGCLIPVGEDGEWIYTDEALANHVPGTKPHAVLLVGSDPDGLHLVSGAVVEYVSKEWWKTYGITQFAVLALGWVVR